MVVIADIKNLSGPGKEAEACGNHSHFRQGAHPVKKIVYHKIFTLDCVDASALPLPFQFLS